MNLLLTGGSVYQKGMFISADVAISEGRIVSVGSNLPREGFSVIQVNDDLVLPGFVDVHVHLREPGFSYKETIATGTAAAAAGGYTAVCAMPNLNPVPDSAWNLRKELKAIRRDARVRVYPYGAISGGESGAELSDMEGMAKNVVGFSDDGKGVQDRELMRKAMLTAKKLDLPIVAHCEDNTLLTPGWCVHNGEFARRNQLPGNNSESEWKQVERDLDLVRETGCRYHVCHISTKESVALIRKAKAEGLSVTCETAPHYLLLCDADLQDDGRFKMNPPIRSAADRDALIAGLLDGTIDCIATDHAPHSAEEKSRGLRGSLNGIVGLETAFPVLYTGLVENGIVPLDVLIDRLCIRPRNIFQLPGGIIEEGAVADLTVIDTSRPHSIDAGSFRSMGHATPFDGWPVTAAVALTICNGEAAYGSVGNGEE
ncbi:MAG: dihydroorotase [Oscillibacter sp.]|jgi:dihydroorotase|nr:dihydroorotase [Oscillibacter sp.]